MGTTVRKLIVEVIDARNLLPKDGHGTSSPYVLVDFNGQRKRTQTAVRDLNPTWNQTLEFDASKGAASDLFGDMLELDVFHDRNYGPTRRNNFLGRVRLSSTQFVKKGEEALMYFPLEKKHLFSWIQGEIGLKIYYVNEVVPPPAPPPDPPAPQPPAEEPTKSEPAPPPPAEAPPESETKTVGEEEAKESKPDEPPPPSPPEEPAKDSADASCDPVEPSPSEAVQPLEETEIKAASGSVSAPEVKVMGPPTPRYNAPQPIRRSVSMASSLDQAEKIPIERSSFDLVEKMHYLFVRVVKARSLPTNGTPSVKIVVCGSQVVSKPARKNHLFEWDQTFAFGRDAPDSSSLLEVSVWDPPPSDPNSDVAGTNFLGGICFDVTEIPLRDPPDSPLAPQWYRLEGGGAHNGDLMLATWVGTQADEAFPEAWKTDTAGNPNSSSKVYVSPKLWYLRATVIEAQDLLPLTAAKEASFQVRAQLSFQVLKTKVAVSRSGSPSWNEDLLFVAAEPFSDQLVFSLEFRQPKGPVVLGIATISLTSIERRVDDRKVTSRWFTFDDPNQESKEIKSYKGRVHLRLCFDGGYHVMDEAAHVCSDYRPTARQLWKPPIGQVELGIIGCKNLLPVKSINGKGSTDAYTVAKYGQKWVRTRTVSDCLEPRWNEQYTWKVYDPCTVLTIGVFDFAGPQSSDVEPCKDATHPELRLGKVRIRISTLETGKVYRNTYPLLLLSQTGTKKMGEIEVAVRFARASPTLDLIHLYSQPLLPIMHHIKPLGAIQQELLRTTATKIVAAYLSRSEPPLKREVVLYMLDADSHAFSMRKVRANWFRIINVIAGLIDIVKWVDDTRSWKNPTSTILVYALLIMLVWFPDLIIPTLSFYMFVIGAWNYRFRSEAPLPHFDPKISLVDSVDRDELDEEFDTVPSSRPFEVVRGRYDRLRILGARVQKGLGDLATQGERVQALVTWRDPRATGIFIGLCLVVALVLYLAPSKMVALASGFYYLRHPIFRDRMPSPALNFFRRLPSLSDRVM
ncbi:Protein of unknown function DUF3292 [Dillenia turbinata]|uniref:C2 domain-containing protein n=1 Tax=Dillenia turbinata TaxID=194707 RepID=A0AAN8W6E7_9MAGN